MTRRNRSINTAAVATPTSNFTPPTPELEYVQFNHRNIKAAAEFGIVRRKLATHKRSKDKCDLWSKVMEDMAYPTIIEPVEPIQE